MAPTNPPPRWVDLPHAPAVGTALLPQDQLEDGQVRLVQLGTQPAGFGVLLLRSAGSVRAYANRCAHFGVPLAARQEHLKFVPHQSLSCNVHYARYRWDDGVCDRGDCVGERLLPIPVVVGEDGMISIAAQA